MESPAKAKTIKKYLGKDFEVLASYGHVRDLVPKEGAVNPERNFEMRYALIERNERHVDAIERAMRKAHSLYLATDPDREGEAISWHLHEIIKERGVQPRRLRSCFIMEAQDTRCGRAGEIHISVGEAMTMRRRRRQPR